MNLISTSGYLQSGKDEVTKMIQYLTSKDKDSMDYFTWLDSIDRTITWQNKKYAGPLRKVCSVLLGIPEHKFDDIKVKTMELPEEWWYVVRDGKLYPYQEYKLGDVIYKPTVRNFLQRVGTEAFRNVIHPNTWINALYADYNSDSKWIISDVRFIGEADAVRKRGGLILRVNRFDLKFDNKDLCVCGKGGICPNNKTGDDKVCHRKELERYFHESETNMDNYDFDYIIENKGSIEELLEKVKKMLQHFNIS